DRLISGAQRCVKSLVQPVTIDTVIDMLMDVGLVFPGNNGLLTVTYHLLGWTGSQCGETCGALGRGKQCNHTVWHAHWLPRVPLNVCPPGTSARDHSSAGRMPHGVLPKCLHAPEFGDPRRHHYFAVHRRKPSKQVRHFAYEPGASLLLVPCVGVSMETRRTRSEVFEVTQDGARLGIARACDFIATDGERLNISIRWGEMIRHKHKKDSINCWASDARGLGYS